MAHTYEEHIRQGSFFTRWRNFWWNYPYLLLNIFKRLQTLRKIFIVVAISLLFCLLYFVIDRRLVLGRIPTNTVSIGVTDNATYNPLVDTTISRVINTLVFNPLLSVTNQDIPVPVLASAVDDTDPVDIAITLKSAVHWEDGKPFSADDVLYSFNLQKKLNPTGFIAKMSIKKIDATHVRIQLPSVDVNVWQDLSWPIFPAHPIYGNAEEIGTGPYMLERSQDNTYYLSANATYFNGPVQIKQLIIKTYPSNDALVYAYENGDITMYSLTDGTAEEGFRIQNANHKNVFSIPILSSYDALFFNMQALKDPNLRKGIAYAINKQSLLSLLPKGSLLMQGPIPTASWAYSGDFNRYRFSSSSALQSFKAAGYQLVNNTLVNGNNEPLKLTIAYLTRSTNIAALATIASNLKDIGIQIDLHGYNDADWTKHILVGREFSVAFSQVQTNIDPNPSGLWSSTSKANISGYTNSVVDEFLTLGQNTSNPTARIRAYALFQKDLMNDVPAVFLYNPTIIFEAKDTVTNIAIASSITQQSDVFNTIQNWKLK